MVVVCFSVFLGGGGGRSHTLVVPCQVKLKTSSDMSCSAFISGCLLAFRQRYANLNKHPQTRHVHQL